MSIIRYISDKDTIQKKLNTKYENMFARATKDYVKARQGCYRGVTIAPEWDKRVVGKDRALADFMDYILSTTGLYYYDKTIAALDKDLLSVPGEAKIYAPDRCLLIPTTLNTALEWFSISHASYADIITSNDDGTFTISLGNREPVTTKTLDAAIAQFCQWKECEKAALISSYDELPDIVMQALQNYDIYAHNGLHRYDWV